MATDITKIKPQLQVQDEGTPLTRRDVIDFVGAGVTATDDALNNKTIVTVAGASGVFGISDATGTYTYYATLTLAMAAATAGQTIELFADVTETGAVTITLKNGVNIQGNGHTYTLNTNDSTTAFVTPVSVNTSLSFTNINIVRSVGSGACMVLGTNSSSTIDFSGTRMINTGTGLGFTGALSVSAEISNLYASAVSAAAIQTNTPGQILKFCEGRSISGYGLHTVNGGVYYNCLGISNSSFGIYLQTGNGTAYNSIGVSSSSTGIANAGYCFNCIGRSISSNGFSNSLQATECTGISTSGAGLALSGKSFNCNGWSSSGNGIRMEAGVEIYNCSSYSVSSFSIWNTNGVSNKLYNCNITTNYNNAAGYGVGGNIGNFPLTFINCTFKLANNTAPYLFNGGIAKALELVNNVYQGGAVYNANLTQSVVSTKDNQGNIFL